VDFFDTSDYEFDQVRICEQNENQPFLSPTKLSCTLPCAGFNHLVLTISDVK